MQVKHMLHYITASGDTSPTLNFQTNFQKIELVVKFSFLEAYFWNSKEFGANFRGHSIYKRWSKQEK